MTNLQSPVAESVIVLRSKAIDTKKLLYLIGFEDEFVANVFLANTNSAFEIVKKHSLNEISIDFLIDLKQQEGPDVALICDCHAIKTNKFTFLNLIRTEPTLKEIPFIVINRGND